MKNIKPYNLFLEKQRAMWIGKMHEFSIYDFWEELKGYLWSEKSIDMKRIKLWSDHFVGDGIFEKIENRVVGIFNALDEVDIENVNDRLYDIFDEYVHNSRWCSLCVLYSDLNENDEKKYNGSISISEKNFDRRKMEMIISILRDIIYPTLFTKQDDKFPSGSLRRTDSEQYVTDKKYQCVNFNKDTIIDAVSFSVSYKLKRYDVNKMIDLYMPGIYISIDSRNGYMKNPFNLKKVEKDFDEVLPSILPSLDYKEVIWDASRGIRRFDDDMEIYDYSVKILLNLK